MEFIEVSERKLNLNWILNNNVNKWRRGKIISGRRNSVRKGMHVKPCWENIIFPVFRNRREGWIGDEAWREM